jgi:hypothetical protein
VLERLLIETVGAVELIAIGGKASLVLEECPFQFLVSGLAGGGEGQVVTGICQIVAACFHEDSGALTMGRGDIAMVAELLINQQPAF